MAIYAKFAKNFSHSPVMVTFSYRWTIQTILELELKPKQTINYNE